MGWFVTASDSGSLLFLYAELVDDVPDSTHAIGRVEYGAALMVVVDCSYDGYGSTADGRFDSNRADSLASELLHHALEERLVRYLVSHDHVGLTRWRNSFGLFVIACWTSQCAHHHYAEVCVTRP